MPDNKNTELVFSIRRYLHVKNVEYLCVKWCTVNCSNSLSAWPECLYIWLQKESSETAMRTFAFAESYVYQQEKRKRLYSGEDLASSLSNMQMAEVADDLWGIYKRVWIATAFLQVLVFLSLQKGTWILSISRHIIFNFEAS